MWELGKRGCCCGNEQTMEQLADAPWWTHKAKCAIVDVILGPPQVQSIVMAASEDCMLLLKLDHGCWHCQTATIAHSNESIVVVVVNNGGF